MRWVKAFCSIVDRINACPCLCYKIKQILLYQCVLKLPRLITLLWFHKLICVRTVVEVSNGV